MRLSLVLCHLNRAFHWILGLHGNHAILPFKSSIQRLQHRGFLEFTAGSAEATYIHLQHSGGYLKLNIAFSKIFGEVYYDQKI